MQLELFNFFFLIQMLSFGRLNVVVFLNDFYGCSLPIKQKHFVAGEDLDPLHREAEKMATSKTSGGGEQQL